MHADTTMRPPGSPLQANRVRQSKPDIHKLSLHDAAGGPWPVSELGLGPPPALAAFAFTLRDDVAASAVSQLVMRQAVHPDDAPDAVARRATACVSDNRQLLHVLCHTVFGMCGSCRRKTSV